MLKIGEYNNLKVNREVDFGYYLADERGHEVLIPKKLTQGYEINLGDMIDVFVYRDSSDRPIATFKKPIAKVGDVAYLEVKSIADFGAFADLGLDRDIFIPLKEQRFKLKTGERYLFYIYLDKTERLAATTKVENYIDLAEEGTYKVNDEVEAMVYAKGKNGTLSVAVDGKYKGLVLANEYYENVLPGAKMNLRVKRIYEDGTIGLTPRKSRLAERSELQEKIVKYMKINDGFMPFNDKSSPEDIKATFGTSKNYFKIAIGGLMKEGVLKQDREGCRLI